MRLFVMLTLLVCRLLLLSAVNKEYELSPTSEEYNTRYFYCSNYYAPQLSDKIEYIDVELPQVFVIELSTLIDGEQTVVAYNDNKKLVISKEGNTYRVNRLMIDAECNHKISLYFINKKIKIYFDEQKVGELSASLDNKKRVGVKWDKKWGNSHRFMNCFEPVPFKVADYGRSLEGGRLYADRSFRKTRHGVDEPYSLTYPTDITNHSKRSIRFEYRYENALKDGASKMRRGRSEISGVYSESPMNKWIMDFDFYVPSETREDSTCSEAVTQLHEGSLTPTFPTFVISVINGSLQCNVKGDSTLISEWKINKRPFHINYSKQYPLEKETWHHIKAYIKEGYQISAMPLTMVWVDGTLVFESYMPNCYNYPPAAEGIFDYHSFGVYKSSWVRGVVPDSTIQTRIYYFDNYIVRH